MTTHEQIQDWIAVYRDLDEETRQLVDTHMEACEDCAHAIAGTQRVDRALAGLDQPAPDASLRDAFYREIGWAGSETAEERGRLRHLPTMLSAAAAVVVLVVLVGVLRALLNDAPNQTTAQLHTSTTPTVVGFSSDGITLASYRPNTAGIIPGEPLHITLNWESTVDAKTARTTFVRLYDNTETLIAQSERRLTFSPQAPTMTDFHEVVVPADVETAAGPYHLTAAIGDTSSETEASLTELSIITPDEDFVVAGSVEEISAGSVTHLSLDATFTDPWPRSIGIRQPAVVSGTSGVSVSPIPIWLVRDEEGDFRALYNRDPSSGCQINYQEQDERFIDPCYGADYSQQGELLEYTSPRGLDRFPVAMRDGQVLVDVSHLIFGSPAPHPPTPPAIITQETYTNTPPARTPTPEVAIVATPVWSTRVGIQGAITQLHQAGCNNDVDAYRELLDPDAPANWRENRIEVFRSNPTCPENQTDIERISVNGDWAMAAVRIDNGAYGLRYFHRSDDGLWKLTAPVAEPWGEMRTLRTELVALRYHAFDDPYVQEVAPSLDAFVHQVANDLGIPIDTDQPIVMHVVPADRGRLDLLAGTPPPLTISPLSVPGFIDGVTTTTPADALQRALFEILTGHLIRSTFPERYDEEWQRFVEGVRYWEVLHARGTYSREQALDAVADASTRQPVSTLLDPQYTEPDISIQQFFALFTFITETYGRNSLGPLVEAGFHADDWETVVTQALNEYPEEFRRRWNEWIEVNQ